VAIDGSGNLYIGDFGNHRVLAFLAPLTDTSADKVFGQANKMGSNTCNLGGAIISRSSLCNPTSVGTDSAGNLYVADYGNHRVLAYNTPLVSDTSADKVFGQSNSFTTADCNKIGKVNANTLCYPYFLAVNTLGDLYVSDYSNNRVLKFNTPLVAGGNTTADRVFGQGNLFNQNSVKALSPNSLNGPAGIAIDGAGSLFIADQNNNRVLQFLAP
jgi:sugar lactone lactonase YvrE